MPSPHLVTNDNSNPQQGTGSIVLMKSASEVSAAEGVSINSNVNLVETNSSNSNNSTKEQLNTPPTTEEVRKLFVGGLPTDSMYQKDLVFRCLLCIGRIQLMVD
jgi:hypothetical protein